MKNIEKFLKPVLIVFLVASFLSCKNKKTEKIETEETMPKDTATAVAVFEPFKVMVIKHKVADYDKWRKEYDAHDSIRTAYAISHYMVGRGTDDANKIVTATKFIDLQKAKDFSALPYLKEAMKKAGVISKPEFSYYEVIRNDDTPIDQKDRVMVTHKVKDFDVWLKVYDAEGTAKRMEEGFIDRGLARGIDDPNMVTVVFAITDMKKAKENIKSEAKKKLMVDAGVVGTPEIFFYKVMD
ncbi:hypothetical protein ACFX5D_06715 [Flavobacterium sp. LB3P45]|uniref:Uncharacterized protein n=1 Tax=Flavobacterium fructosi TaxID=3230416 RepID=A0ABW6HKV2_9FLAO